MFGTSVRGTGRDMVAAARAQGVDTIILAITRFSSERLAELNEVAERNGLSFERVAEMPANNLSLVFRHG